MIRDEITLEAEKMKRRCGRLAAIVCEENGDGLRMNYLYDVNGTLSAKEFFLLPDEEIDSISHIYSGARNMEREITDLYGLSIIGSPAGLLLVEDSPVKPMRKSA